MKKLRLLILAFVLCNTVYAQYDAQNISLDARWDDPAVPAEPHYGIRYSSVFGYAANGKEYAIIGSSSGTYFIDVTTPTNPVQLAFYAGKRNMCVWREYQTYQHYLYAVSDDSSPNSLQIFDLDKLPTGTGMKVYDSDSIFSRSHTVFVDGDKLYGGSVTTKTNHYSMAVYSLANPLKPALLHTLNAEYPNVTASVHDMLVRNDTVYASCGYDGFYVFKYKANNTFSMLGSLTSYPDQGYNHSSALTPDGKHAFFTDEVPAGLDLKGIDLTDLSDIKVVSQFRSNDKDTPHNLYMIRADKLVVASYQDGLQIYDVTDPAHPYRTGYFDTFPDNLNGTYFSQAYQGNWGAYVELPSGTILASDMQRGLFILDATLAIGINEVGTFDAAKVNIYPNPFTEKLNIQLTDAKAGAVHIIITDLVGKEVLNEKRTFSAGANTMQVDMPGDLPKGMYIATLQSDKARSSYKIIK